MFYDKDILILIPVLIMNCICDSGIFHKLLNRKLFIFLGENTFEIYLLHKDYYRDNQLAFCE